MVIKNPEWNAGCKVFFLLVAVCVMVSILASIARCDTDATPAIAGVAMAPGRPLDAVLYEAPTMSDYRWCWRMEDRSSGASWWFVRMRDGDGVLRWKVCPIREGTAPVADDLG